jgi:hypothetical protein
MVAEGRSVVDTDNSPHAATCVSLERVVFLWISRGDFFDSEEDERR